MLELTKQAREVLAAAHGAALRFDPDAHIRLSMRAGTLRAEFADGPEPGDSTLEFSGFSLIVQAGITGVVDAGEHNVLSIRKG